MNTARILRTSAILLCSAVLIALLADRCTVGVPSRQRIAEFTGGDLSFELTPVFPSPYHFVIGVPAGSMIPIFRGIIELRDRSGIVAIVPISSDTARPCNWLTEAPGVSGYILAWNEPRDLSKLLRRGGTYQVHISFSKPLPPGVSLWFCSIRHVSIIFERNA